MKKVGAEFVKRELINECLGKFTFKLDKEIKFNPGQFNGLTLIGKDGKRITRSYSISSTVKDLPNIEFYIRWVKKGGKREDGEGQFTHEIFGDHPDKLKFEMLDKGMGELHLNKNEKRKRIFICTGTGLAPYMSILRTARDKKIDLSGSILIQGVKSKEDLGFEDELKDISNKTKIKVIHVESRGSCENCDEGTNYVSELFFNRTEGSSGRVSVEEIESSINEDRLKDPKINNYLESPLSKKDYVVLLCGNPAMINNMSKVLEGHGFKDKKDIIAEKYWV